VFTAENQRVKTGLVRQISILTYIKSYIIKYLILWKFSARYDYCCSSLYIIRSV